MFDKLFIFLIYCICMTRVQESACHVLNYDSVTVCDGRLKQIQCPNSENIHVLQGFYGKWKNHDCKGEHPDPDNTPTCVKDRTKTTAIVKDICQGKNTCKLTADKSIFGEPCPPNKAYLYVTFFCLAPGRKLNHQKTSTNQEVVTVPSHGYVVQERSAGEPEKSKEEKDVKKVLLPPGNPTPDIKLTSSGQDRSVPAKTTQLTKPREKALVESDASQKSVLPDHDVENGTDKNVRSSTICNGQSKLIACLPEEGIKVHYAFYGKKSGADCKGKLPYKDESPTCSALDAKSNVQSSCDGKQTCLLFADDNIYGKSLCPNVNKYLQLKYSCVALPPEVSPTVMRLTPQEDLEEDAVSRSAVVERENSTVKICNGERRTISCQRGVGMNIQSAFYGKRVGKDCRGDLAYRDDIPECNNPRALESVKFLCENRDTCELASESDLFGDDVCAGVNKYLEVTYAC